MDESIEFTLPRGLTKSSAIRALYSFVDEVYSSGPTPDVHGESESEPQDPDLRTESGVGTGSDVGEADSEPGSEAGDSGSSDSPPELGGGETDEGVGTVADNAPEQTGGTDVEPSPSERAEETSRRGSHEYADSDFHFAPGVHSRGDL